MSRQERLGEHYSRYSKNSIDESNKNNYESNNFNSVFSQQNRNLSIINEPNMEYTKTNKYLVLSSKDRDTSIYPSSSQYVLNLDQEYKNVSRIELIQAIIPDKNSVTAEPYLLLNIKELENTMESNNKELCDAFTILQLNQPIVSGAFIQLMTQIHEHVVLNYKTPKASLSKITISITDADGQVFDFGGSGSTAKEFQTLFVFKITMLENNQNVINHRNVY
jgi:hypothetical protein